MPTKYTITYKLNGGSYGGSKDDIKEVYEENTMIKIHAAPSRDGYKFLYWEGSSYYPNDDYKVTENHTFVAKWKKIGGGTDTKYFVPPTGIDDNFNLYIVLLLGSILSFVSYLFLKKRQV
ncbi:MAG: InlB B-repeat-containing protein [Solobacterium sp.]|nr:InlB B-repeat-containing protein [Solobacterium sp.]